MGDKLSFCLRTCTIVPTLRQNHNRNCHSELSRVAVAMFAMLLARPAISPSMVAQAGLRKKRRIVITGTPTLSGSPPVSLASPVVALICLSRSGALRMCPVPESPFAPASAGGIYGNHRITTLSQRTGRSLSSPGACDARAS